MSQITVFTDHEKGLISIKSNGDEAATLNIRAVGWGEAEALTVLIVAALRTNDAPEPAPRTSREASAREAREAAT